MQHPDRPKSPEPDTTNEHLPGLVIPRGTARPRKPNDQVLKLVIPQVPPTACNPNDIAGNDKRGPSSTLLELLLGRDGCDGNAAVASETRSGEVPHPQTIEGKETVVEAEAWEEGRASQPHLPPWMIYQQRTEIEAGARHIDADQSNEGAWREVGFNPWVGRWGAVGEPIPAKPKQVARMREKKAAIGEEEAIEVICKAHKFDKKVLKRMVAELDEAMQSQAARKIAEEKWKAEEEERCHELQKLVAQVAEEEIGRGKSLDKTKQNVEESGEADGNDDEKDEKERLRKRQEQEALRAWRIREYQKAREEAEEIEKRKVKDETRDEERDSGKEEEHSSDLGVAETREQSKDGSTHGQATCAEAKDEDAGSAAQNGWLVVKVGNFKDRLRRR